MNVEKTDAKATKKVHFHIVLTSPWAARLVFCYYCKFGTPLIVSVIIIEIRYHKSIDTVRVLIP